MVPVGTCASSLVGGFCRNFLPGPGFCAQKRKISCTDMKEGWCSFMCNQVSTIIEEGHVPCRICEIKMNNKYVLRLWSLKKKTPLKYLKSDFFPKKTQCRFLSMYKKMWILDKWFSRSNDFLLRIYFQGSPIKKNPKKNKRKQPLWFCNYKYLLLNQLYLFWNKIMD